MTLHAHTTRLQVLSIERSFSTNGLRDLVSRWSVCPAGGCRRTPRRFFRSTVQLFQRIRPCGDHSGVVADAVRLFDCWDKIYFLTRTAIERDFAHSSCEKLMNYFDSSLTLSVGARGVFFSARLDEVIATGWKTSIFRDSFTRRNHSKNAKCVEDSIHMNIYIYD